MQDNIIQKLIMESYVSAVEQFNKVGDEMRAKAQALDVPNLSDEDTALFFIEQAMLSADAFNPLAAATAAHMLNLGTNTIQAMIETNGIVLDMVKDGMLPPMDPRAAREVADIQELCTLLVKIREVAERLILSKVTTEEEEKSGGEEESKPEPAAKARSHKFSDDKAEELHMITLESFHNDECGSVEMGCWHALIIQPDGLTSPSYILTVDEEGFVDYDEYDTIEQAQADWEQNMKAHDQ
jgi:hypothetical protein